MVKYSNVRGKIMTKGTAKTNNAEHLTSALLDLVPIKNVFSHHSIESVFLALRKLWFMTLNKICFYCHFENCSVNLLISDKQNASQSMVHKTIINNCHQFFGTFSYYSWRMRGNEIRAQHMLYLNLCVLHKH